MRPDVFLDLQIHLDRLDRTAEKCRAALGRMVHGEIGPDDYQEFLDRQRGAQREWEAKNRKYFASSTAGDDGPGEPTA